LKGSTLTLTLVNTNATQPTETTIRLFAGALKGVVGTTGMVYGDEGIQAHNTFDDPNVVTLGAQNLVASHDPTGLVVNLPPASVTKFTIEL
jgi:alpha-L-arabinofuranosidase